MKALEKILDDLSMDDEHHRIQKSKGGSRKPHNLTLVKATEHRDQHGNTPDRPTTLEELKSLVEQRIRYIKTQVGLANKLTAMKRGMDELPEEEVSFYKDTFAHLDEHVKAIEKEIKRTVKNVNLPIIDKLRDIKGIGDVYIAVLITALNPEKAPHVSSFWAYAGYHGYSKERYTKGTKGGGNKYFRTQLYKIAMNFLKNKNEYYEPVYRAEKERLENSEVICKETQTGGKVKEIPWKDATKNHRHLAAIRKMMKLFLSHLWLVWRELEGLEISEPYAMGKLGHTHIITPEECGWK